MSEKVENIISLINKDILPPINQDKTFGISTFTLSSANKSEIKKQAYKDFADIVKKNIKEVWNYDNGTCSCVLVLTKDIDKILTEMAGELE